MQILKYEMKKILCKKSTVVSLIVLGLYLGISLAFLINETIYVNSKGDEITGIKAIQLIKNEKLKWNTSLTEDIISKVINENNEINFDSKYSDVKETDVQLSNIKFAQKQGFSDIRDLINHSYGEFRSYDYYLVDRLKTQDGVRFYTNRIHQLKTWLDSDDANRLTKGEKSYLLNSAKTLETPFQYSYADGWVKALEFSATVLFALSFILCVIMAPTFSVEYQTGADAIILSTEYGKKQGILYKIIAGVLSVSIVYWVTVCTIFGVIIGLYGVEGGYCQIQGFSAGWKSFYHISNSQALCMVLLLGYVACLFIGSLAMFLSAKLKTSFATIILIILIIMVPALVGESLALGSLGDKIVNLLPHQMLQGWTLLRTYTFFDIGTTIYTPYQILPCLYGIISIVLLPFTYQAFRQHQIY